MTRGIRHAISGLSKYGWNARDIQTLHELRRLEGLDQHQARVETLLNELPSYSGVMKCTAYEDDPAIRKELANLLSFPDTISIYHHDSCQNSLRPEFSGDGDGLHTTVSVESLVSTASYHLFNDLNYRFLVVHDKDLVFPVRHGAHSLECGFLMANPRQNQSSIAHLLLL